MAFAAGLAIHERRLERRWTLRSLASRAGISTSHLAALEAGRGASLETYARIAHALDLRPELTLADPRRTKPRGDEDFVHAAMGELEARRLRGHGFEVRIDEPYQHFQFAGRADLVAWDRDARALLHIENRTRFPNVQEALGSFSAKRAYLGRVLAERLELRGGWQIETHVVAVAWTAEALHVLRLRAETFGAACPDGIEPFEAWWSGRSPRDGPPSDRPPSDRMPSDRPSSDRTSTSSLVILDPAAAGRQAAFRSFDGRGVVPRHRGYAELAERLRSGPRGT